jgi:hypothetical protein
MLFSRLATQLKFSTFAKISQKLHYWLCCKNLRQTCSIIKSQFTTRSDELKAAI